MLSMVLSYVKQVGQLLYLSKFYLGQIPEHLPLALTVHDSPPQLYVGHLPGTATGDSFIRKCLSYVVRCIRNSSPLLFPHIPWARMDEL